ncbi:DUF1778 domain-containing protein [Idiomarina piscisalsi]|uniref:type II toxin -antitoxin system TacA 1-like antitoxin n=1 Tax=Idiomarina piscisalsi TaxID=1096243 RepID=UPI0026EC7E37|nr:DUF1778 domain-containing protein [Idiomarina piscisalsi]
MKEIRIKPGQKMNKKTKSEKVKAAIQRTKLNQETWEKLNKVINEPPEPTKELKTLMKNN